MSYGNTYVLVLARSVDILLASWFWRDYDITISSMCGLELRKRALGRPAKGWLCWLGGVLGKIQTDHCEQAIAADLLRAQQAQGILTSGPVARS